VFEISQIARRIMRSVINRIQTHLCVFRPKMVVYTTTKAGIVPFPLNLGTDVVYKEAHCIDEYVDLLNRYQMQQSPLAHERFANYNACFVAFCNQHHVISSGWYAGHCQDFPITEINKKIDIPGGVYMLFDFMTNDMFRRQGYYTKLLNHICLQLDGNRFMIGALASNIRSRKGIERNGFVPIGSFVCCSSSYNKIMAKYEIVSR